MGTVVDGYLIIRPGDGTVDLASLSTGAGTTYAATSVAGVLAVVLTTRGDLLTRDGTGVVRLPVGAADSTLGSNGTDVVYRTPAQQRTAIGVYGNGWTDDFSSAARWTLVQGNGTAAISGGVFSSTTPSGVSTATPNRPSASASIPVATRGADVLARLASFTGTLSTPRAMLNVSNVADGANNPYTGGVSDFGISVLINADGSMDIGELSGGTGGLRESCDSRRRLDPDERHGLGARRCDAHVVQRAHWRRQRPRHRGMDRAAHASDHMGREAPHDGIASRIPNGNRRPGSRRDVGRRDRRESVTPTQPARRRRCTRGRGAWPTGRPTRTSRCWEWCRASSTRWRPR